MSDFSNLSYKEKTLLLEEIKESVFNHKHTQDELNKISDIADFKNLAIFNDYNPFDRNVIELIKKNKNKNKNGTN